MLRAIVVCLFAFAALARPTSAADERAALEALIAQHASANGVPVGAGAPRHPARERL
jgi:hypothetical protein